MIKLLLLVATLGLSQAAQASIDVREFNNPVDEQRYRELIAELRCPKCQNTNLAGSDAGLALDLKDRVYEQLMAGRSDQEIRDYMISRYGDFITYNPPVRGSTYILWYGPFVLLAVVALVIWRRALRQKPTSKPLTADEAKRLQALLQNPSERS